MRSTIEIFYEAFTNLDADKMIKCYHDDIIFEDPAFGILKGKRAKAMWQMLCASQKNKDFKVVISKIEANKKKGSAHWESFYNFSKTSRKIHNKIDAKFEFKDGLIIKNTDTFNLNNWAKQALGLKGLIIGGTRYFSNKLQSQTNHLLNKYLE